MTKRRVIKFILATLLMLAGVGAYSYDNMATHPDLTRAAAEIFNNQAQSTLTQEQINWIVEGSIAEDADPRYKNHFYDPNTGKGLDDYDTAFRVYQHVTGISAKEWAKNQASIVGVSGDYAESAILENYRQGSYERAYQGIGHILHLIQDMDVPAHTRNDSHAQGDPYEKWAQLNGKINVSKARFITVNGLEEAFDNLSTYSNKNFFSKDTIRNVISTQVKNIKVGSEIHEYVYCNDGESHDFICLRKIETPSSIFYDVDEFKIHQDYWSLLHPKAVGYSAGVIDLFVKRFAEIDKEKASEKLSIWQKTKEFFYGIIDETSGSVKYALGDTLIASRTVLDDFLGSAEQVGQETQFVVDANKEIITNVAKEVSNKASEVSAAAAQKIEAAADKTKVLGVKITSAVKSPVLNDLIAPKSTSAKIDSGAKEAPAEAGTNSKPLSLAPIIDKSLWLDQKPPSLPTENSGKTIFLAPSGFILPVGVPPASEPSIPAADQAASSSPATSTEIVIPETAIVKSPSSIASSTRAEFAFSSTIAPEKFECNLNYSGWSLCDKEAAFETSEGDNFLQVRAMVDSAVVDPSPAELAWLVDTTAPVASINPLAASHFGAFVVSWSGSDEVFAASSTSGLAAFDVQYRVGEIDWQDWLKTSATSSMFESQASVTNISFRVRSVDYAGNIGDWSQSAETLVKSSRASHVVISELAVNGPAGASDEFVELYNPTDSIIDLSGWRLQSKAASSTTWLNRVDFDKISGVIPINGYYLLASEKYSRGITPNYRHDANWGLSDVGGHVRIIDGNNNEVDRLGYGTAAEPEGAAIKTDLSHDGSLERKAFASSTAELMTEEHSTSGNGFDTDNNANDFIFRAIPEPQNSTSGNEPRLEVLPAAINDLKAVPAYVSSNTIKLGWTSPLNAFVNDNAFYEVRYQKQAGECGLVADWDNASVATTEGSAKPANQSGQAVEVKIKDLEANKDYCFAVKTYNGQNWSEASNQVSLTTLKPSIKEVMALPGYAIIEGRMQLPSQTLSADKGPYLIDRSFDIPVGSKVIIEPGTVLKFDNFAEWQWMINSAIAGTLIARGTAENPIVFTSIFDDEIGGDSNGDGNTTKPWTGAWGSFHVYGQLEFDHVIFRYSGSDDRGSLIFQSTGIGEISNSIFEHNRFPISINKADHTGIFLENNQDMN